LGSFNIKEKQELKALIQKLGKNYFLLGGGMFCEELDDTVTILI
jgi:hypothetical protein